MTGRPRTFGAWARMHLFRLWTAVVTLAGFGYLWVNRPEWLTWWKRSVDELVRTGCSWLPYPWGDRIESTIGNFGIWVQLTLAILALRIVVGLLLMGFRRARAP